jgi:fructose/tagatose bisphosphate aldolase
MENTTQTPQINIADLETLRAIIDLAAQRGAFRGAELQQVGNAFDKLSAFLTYIVEQAQANASTKDSDVAVNTDAGDADTTEPTQGE